MLLELLKYHKFKIVLSLFLGFALATVFRKVCKDKSCVVIKAPNPNEIKNNTYKHNNKCYKYQTDTYTCDKNVVE